MAEPAAPDSEVREHLLDELGALVERSGAARLLLPPIAPGVAAFPEPWAPSPDGVTLLLRRLAWHAGLDLGIEVEDDRAGAPPPTERKPATQCELVELRAGAAAVAAPARPTAVFALGFVGDDAIAGTLAHEVGVAHAVDSRGEHDGPYRTPERATVAVDHEHDLERGSIATVYLGLGVLAANAAYQQYSRGGRTAYDRLEYDVLRAGYLSMSELAYLLAVQATVRGEASPPAGLDPPQRDEVISWLAALRGSGPALRARLGVPEDARPEARPPVEIFEDAALERAPAAARTAFRWRTNRGGVGLLAGTVLGFGAAALVASRGMALSFAFGGAAAGHVVGRRVRVPRCSACAAIVPPDAARCGRCGARLRGEIFSLADRLDAEEALDEDAPRPPG